MNGFNLEIRVCTRIRIHICVFIFHVFSLQNLFTMCSLATVVSLVNKLFALFALLTTYEIGGLLKTRMSNREDIWLENDVLIIYFFTHVKLKKKIETR